MQHQSILIKKRLKIIYYTVINMYTATVPRIEISALVLHICAGSDAQEFISYAKV